MLMDAALHWYTGWRLPQILGNWGNSEWIRCNDVMAEAVKPRWLHPTFTLYIYKVFKHLKMLCIGSWMQPYTDTPAEGWPRFLGNWGNSEWIWCHDVMVVAIKHRWLHPTFTYIYKVFEHLKMLWIAHGCGLALIHRLTVGPDLRKLGYFWVDMMPWCHGWGC